MKRKVLTVILSVALMLGLISVPAEATQLECNDSLAVNTESIKKTNLSNDIVDGGDEWGYSPGFFPNGSISDSNDGISTASIVGIDNRYPVSSTTIGPYCNTVYLEVSWDGGAHSIIASGFMLGPSAVLTAGHCVYDYGTTNNGYGLAESATIIPAKNGSVEPFGRANSVDFIVPTYSVTGCREDDWAIIIIDQPLGNQTGWLGLRWQQASYDGTFVYNTGYPHPDHAESQADDQSLMLVNTGYVRETTANFIKGDWDATGGNSGGPLYFNSAEMGYTAIGILTTGSEENTFYQPYPTSHTTATRFTQEMYDIFVQYR